MQKRDTGISVMDTSLFSVCSRNGQIVITGLSDGDVVKAYDVVGKLITTTIATDSSVVINANSYEGSVVILTAGTCYAKVLIK